MNLLGIACVAGLAFVSLSSESAHYFQHVRVWKSFTSPTTAQCVISNAETVRDRYVRVYGTSYRDGYACLCIRGGGRQGPRTKDELPAGTRAAAGGSALSPRLFSGKRRRKGPDTHTQDTEQLRFDERFRGTAGESDLSALQAEEAELLAAPPVPAAESPPPEGVSDDGPAWGHRGGDKGRDAAVAAALAKWDEEEEDKGQAPARIGPVSFSYDHVEAAAQLEAEERQRRARAYTHAHARARTHTHARTHAPACTHVRTYVRMRTRTRTRTHTRTRTPPRSCRNRLLHPHLPRRRPTVAHGSRRLAERREREAAARAPVRRRGGWSINGEGLPETGRWGP